jgi:hypothetical protein
MELVIQILMLFIVINTLLKLSFWKWWQTLIFGGVVALFVMMMEQYAIVQSKTQLNDYLMNREALQNAAVLVTIESALCFAFCFAMLRNKLVGRKKLWVRLLHWYPGLLVFPVLFYLLTQSIFTMTGVNFDTVTLLFAMGVLVIIPLAGYLVRLLLPENEFKLEVHFLVSLFVAIIGLLTTVNGNVTYAAASQPLNIKGIVIAVLLFAITFLIGYFWNRFKWRYLQKRKLLKKHTK